MYVCMWSDHIQTYIHTYICMWSDSSGGRASDCRSMGCWFEPHLWWEVQELLMIHESAFYWPGCTLQFHPSGVCTMSRGNSLFGGTSLWPSPRVLQELGPTRGLPPANWGVHTYMPCMLVAGLALQSNDWGVKSVRANSAFHPSGVGTWAGGNLGLPGGTPGPYQGP